MKLIVHLINGNNPEIENHYFQKEYRNDVIVQLNELFYEVYFFTRDSLNYEMTNDGFFSMPGIIILEEICLKRILTSIENLAALGFFDNFIGKNSLEINARFLNKWYLNVSDLNNENTVTIHLR